MAQIFPPDIEAARMGGESPDELETLIALRHGFSDDYLIYHSAHWSTVRPKYTDFGEIDYDVELAVLGEHECQQPRVPATTGQDSRVRTPWE